MGLILAAGKSKRFGQQNKLLAPIQNKPLVTYAIEVMRQADLVHRAALVDDPKLDCLFEGFEILRPTSASAGLGENLAVGATYAQKMKASHLLITLGDMPLVTAETLGEIKSACPDKGISIAKGVKHISVPACFHASYFDQLIALNADKGAGMIARAAEHTNYVSLNDEQLCDVDTLEDLKKVATFL